MGLNFRRFCNLNVTIKKSPTTESPKIQSYTFNSLWLLLVGCNHQFSTFLNKKSLFLLFKKINKNINHIKYENNYKKFKL
jgi:hypothetical protein